MKKITALLLCCLSLFLFTGFEGSTTSTEPKTETVENQELTLSMKDWDSTGLALEDIQRTGTSVSYTHLDVYKRQERYKEQHLGR